MAHPLQKAAVRRKIYYFVAIALLFCVTLFWRGKLDVPLGSPDRVAEDSPTAVNRGADWLAKRSVVEQATELDLREVDQGDPELFTSVLRHSMVGVRGFVVTGLWWGAIEKQKRGEFGEFEVLARLATRLQPHFITPWLYQSWNITFNISVLNDNLTDMYFYIARGIELLAQGDRLNTKRYVVSADESYPVASPDLRYWLGFYFQDKFGVADTVITLRSLMQMSCIPPGERDADAMIVDGSVNRPLFEKFCRENPQLVRRLQTHLNCQRPEDVIRFLKDNKAIPSRFNDNGELASRLEQFPVFPPSDASAREYRNEFPDEYSPKDGPDVIDDTFDAYLAARGWFRYANVVVVPPKTDSEDGTPIPWRTPIQGEYDQLRYRVPARPTLVIFRMNPSRAQTYYAERLTKEGWFDTDTQWNINARGAWIQPANALGSNEDVGPVYLKTPLASKQAYEQAWKMWTDFGNVNGLLMSASAMANLKKKAGIFPNTPEDQIPPIDLENPTPQMLEQMKQTEEQNTAYRALIFSKQNQRLTNFEYFHDMTDAQRSESAIAAQEELWDAAQAVATGKNLAPIQLYSEGLAKWRDVLREFPDYHNLDSNRTDAQELTYKFLASLMELLEDYGDTKREADRVVRALPALYPWLGVSEVDADRLEQAVPLPGVYQAVLSSVAEDEARMRVTIAELSQRNGSLTQAQKQAYALAETLQSGSGTMAGGAMLGGLASLTKLEQGQNYDLEQGIPSDFMLRAAINGEYAWMKEFKQKPVMGARGVLDPRAYWVRPDVRQSVRQELELDAAYQSATREQRPTPSGGSDDVPPPPPSR